MTPIIFFIKGGVIELNFYAQTAVSASFKIFYMHSSLPQNITERPT